MSSGEQTSGGIDRRMVLSTLWIFAMFNYLYADVFTVMFDPAMMDLAMKMPVGVIFAWSVVMETAIAMIFLSRLLKYNANRWSNIICGVVHTLTVAWSLSGETPQPYYIFFAVVEICCTVFIVWYAWHWKPQAAAVGA